MSNKALTAAEATDRHGRLIIVACVCVAAMQVANAIENAAEPPLAGHMETLQLVLAGLAALVILPCLVWKFTRLPRLTADERREYFARDSFTVEAFRFAKSVSWVSALVLLFALGPVSNAYADLPAEVFLDIALGSMLAIFAITAFVKSR